MSLLSACTTNKTIEPVTPVEVRTVQVNKPAPIVPTVDQLTLRPTDWVVITPDNAAQKLAEIKNGEPVFFALTKQGYENMALNSSDIRAIIEQYQSIIAIYKKQF